MKHLSAILILALIVFLTQQPLQIKLLLAVEIAFSFDVNRSNQCLLLGSEAA